MAALQTFEWINCRQANVCSTDREGQKQSSEPKCQVRTTSSPPKSKLNVILLRLETLEISQKKTAQDVKELKDGYKILDHDVIEIQSSLDE